MGVETTGNKLIGKPESKSGGSRQQGNDENASKTLETTYPSGLLFHHPKPPTITPGNPTSIPPILPSGSVHDIPEEEVKEMCIYV